MYISHFFLHKTLQTNSQDPLDRFSQNFRCVVDSRLLKGRCRGNHY